MIKLFRNFMLFFSSLIVFAPLSQAQPSETPKKLNIGVMDLKAEGAISSASGILSDRLRAEFFNTGKFQVMERGEMDAILKEQGFQQSGACDDKACMVEVGQLLGVERMVAGSLGQLGAIYLINLRFIDVKTGQLLETYSGECRCPMEELGGAMKTAAQALALGKKPSAPDTTVAENNTPKAQVAQPAPTPQTLSVEKKRAIGLKLQAIKVDPEFNQFIQTYTNRAKAGFSAFLEPQDELPLTQNLVGFDINFTRDLGRRFALRLSAGPQFSSSTGKYVARDFKNSVIPGHPEPSLPTITVSNDFLNFPTKVGVLFQTLPRRFRASLIADLILQRTTYQTQFTGNYVTFEPSDSSWSAANKVDSKISIKQFGIGLYTAIGGEFHLTPKWGLSVEAGYTNLQITNIEAIGNLDRIERSVGIQPQNPTPSDKTYYFVKNNTDNLYTFINQSEFDKIVANRKLERTSVSLNGGSLGLKVSYHF